MQFSEAEAPTTPWYVPIGQGVGPRGDTEHTQTACDCAARYQHRAHTGITQRRDLGHARIQHVVAQMPLLIHQRG